MEYAVDGGAGDAVSAGQLAQALAALAVAQDGRTHRQRNRRADGAAAIENEGEVICRAGAAYRFGAKARGAWLNVRDRARAADRVVDVARGINRHAIDVGSLCDRGDATGVIPSTGATGWDLLHTHIGK